MKLKRLFLVSFALCLVPAICSATVYDVGPGRQYKQIGDVPWHALGPGDTVRIHYRPSPYYEKLLISSRGTPDAWIRVIGVRGPNGERPIISGRNATTGTGMRYRWQDATGGSALQWLGVIQIAVRADEPNRPAELPGYIEIAGLQVQDGFKDYQFTTEKGVKTNYHSSAACVYARSVQHLLIRDNVLTNCGQGFFNWTGAGTKIWDGLQVNTVLRGNYLHGNGNPSGYLQHQIYTEADGVTIEQNRLGPMRAGALGSQIKDRSAGTVIRYNYIEKTDGWMLDLVEPQESYAALSLRPTYRQAFVYGNVLLNKGGSNLIHWNEDSASGRGRASLPKGRLFFYHNTVLSVLNRSDRWRISIFNTTHGGYECPREDPRGIIDVRNNILALLPRTEGAAMPEFRIGFCSKENFEFGTNWLSAGWQLHTTGTVNGLKNLLTMKGTPGFVDIAAGDLHLRPDSSARWRGGRLAPEVTSNALQMSLLPDSEYVHHLQVIARPLTSLSDLGAFSAGLTELFGGAGPRTAAVPRDH